MQRANLKFFITLLILATNLAHAQSFEADEVLMMDTQEYQYIQHTKAKRRYLKQIGPILRDLQIREGGFDSTRLADSALPFLINNEAQWNIIQTYVYRACELPTKQQLCKKLQDVRIQTLFGIRASGGEN